jgi:ribosomal-protein-alanine N-acetyltransferase
MRYHLSLFVGSIVTITIALHLGGFLPTLPRPTEPQVQPTIERRCSQCKRRSAFNEPHRNAPDFTANNSTNFKRVITNISPGHYRPIIETKRLILRTMHDGDLEQLHSWARKDEVAQSTTWKPHKTMEKSRRTMKRWQEQYRKGGDAPWGIISKENGKLIGSIAVFTFVAKDRRALFGYSIDSAEWGKGYTTEASRAIIEYAFTHLGIENLQAVVRTDNIASRRVMEKSGLSYSATLRDFWLAKGECMTMYLYRILKKDIAVQLGAAS